MARPLRNQLAMTDLHRAVTKLLKSQPITSHREIERWALRHTDLETSHETIRKALTGDCDPTSCSIEVLLILMAFFECEPAALGQFAERRLMSVMAALGADGGTPPGTRTQNLRVSCAEPLVGHLSLVAA